MAPSTHWPQVLAPDSLSFTQTSWMRTTHKTGILHPSNPCSGADETWSGQTRLCHDQALNQRTCSVCLTIRLRSKTASKHSRASFVFTLRRQVKGALLMNIPGSLHSWYELLLPFLYNCTKLLVFEQKIEGKGISMESNLKSTFLNVCVNLMFCWNGNVVLFLNKLS